MGFYLRTNWTASGALNTEQLFYTSARSRIYYHENAFDIRFCIQTNFMWLHFSVFGTFSSLLCLFLICFIYILFMFGFVFETKPSSSFNTLYIRVYTYFGFDSIRHLDVCKERKSERGRGRDEERDRESNREKVAKRGYSVGLRNTTLHHSWTHSKCVHGTKFGKREMWN